MNVKYIITSTAVAQWLRCCATNQKVVGSIPAGVIGFFIDIKSFRSHYGPGVDSASNRNEYREDFLGVKAAGAYSCQPTTILVPLSRNLRALTSWNPLGRPRPVKGLLYLYLYIITNSVFVVHETYNITVWRHHIYHVISDTMLCVSAESRHHQGC